jgi:hypothetical protein
MNFYSIIILKPCILKYKTDLFCTLKVYIVTPCLMIVNFQLSALSAMEVGPGQSHERPMRGRDEGER